MKRAMIAVEAALHRRAVGADAAHGARRAHLRVREARVDELIGIASPLMERAAELSVPLHVDAGRGKSWAACKG
jgi:DNA polymerase I-like protein with 3'-5' exonuclease and polymerase domains